MDQIGGMDRTSRSKIGHFLGAYVVSKDRFAIFLLGVALEKRAAKGIICDWVLWVMRIQTRMVSAEIQAVVRSAEHIKGVGVVGIFFQVTQQVRCRTEGHRQMISFVTTF
jgi:hypothetical protein